LFCSLERDADPNPRTLMNRSGSGKMIQIQIRNTDFCTKFQGYIFCCKDFFLFPLFLKLIFFLLHTYILLFITLVFPLSFRLLPFPLLSFIFLKCPQIANRLISGISKMCGLAEW
jgi:hypothetical protein